MWDSNEQIDQEDQNNVVLIVEDDPDIAELLRYGLENQNFEPLVARTGEEGLRASLDEKRQPAVILLDLLLPGMNGFEVCRRLRSESLTRDTPILILTAKAFETDIAEILSLGADAYITKPFSLRDVISRIRVLLQEKDRASNRYLSVNSP